MKIISDCYSMQREVIPPFHTPSSWDLHPSNETYISHNSFHFILYFKLSGPTASFAPTSFFRFWWIVIRVLRKRGWFTLWLSCETKWALAQFNFAIYGGRKTGKGWGMWDLKQKIYVPATLAKQSLRRIDKE